MNLEEQQKEVSSLINKAMWWGFLGAGVIGSPRAIGYANQALKLIRASDGQLRGEGDAKFARGVGIFGLLIWFPVILIGIVVSVLNQ